MTKRFFFFLAIGILVIVIAGGCAQVASPVPSVAPNNTELPTLIQPTSVEPSTSAPRVATIIEQQDFIDLAPAYTFGIENVATNQCYENLVWMNLPGSEDMFRPGLATSWEHNSDSTEWTFHLRQGVNFQDGTPFDANAVKATIDYYQAQNGAGCTFVWDPVKEVQVVDNSTVKMLLTYAAPMDLRTSATFCGYMVSPEALKNPKEWFDAGNCDGTGPYTIQSFEKGQRLIMTRNEEYWGGWNDTYFDKLDYEVVSDGSVALQMMENKQADADFFAPIDKVIELGKSGELTSVIGPSYWQYMFMLNTKKPPLDNKLVRQALAYSFPYDQLIQKSGGAYTQSRGAVPAAMWGHGSDLFQYTYDPQKAKQLLADAGYPNGGFDLTLTYMSDLPTEAWAVELWSFPLSELGIKLKPQAMTFESLWELAKSDPSKAQDIATFGWFPALVDPYDPLKNMYHCEDTPYWNVSYYCNKTFDTLIDDANSLAATNIQEATQKYIEAQSILIEDSPAIFLVDTPNAWLFSPAISGFEDNPAYPGVIFFHDLTPNK
jgi:peptide/nickel transport system substrate-binding protein